MYEITEILNFLTAENCIGVFTLLYDVNVRRLNTYMCWMYAEENLDILISLIACLLLLGITPNPLPVLSLFTLTRSDEGAFSPLHLVKKFRTMVLTLRRHLDLHSN